MKVGDPIYIPLFKQFGTVEEILPDGRPARARIMTPEGDRVINIVSLIIEAVSISGTLLRLIKQIVNSIRSLIKR